MGLKGLCVNNFVANCPKYNSLNSLKIKLHSKKMLFREDTHCSNFNSLFKYFYTTRGPPDHVTIHRTTN